jgi:hypothetical protein
MLRRVGAATRREIVEIGEREHVAEAWDIAANRFDLRPLHLVLAEDADRL